MTNGIRPLIILIIVSSTFAVRNFELILTDTTCTARADYVADKYCFVNNTKLSDSRLNAHFKSMKEIRDFRIEFSIQLDRQNGDTIPFFKMKNVDGCGLLSMNTTQPMLKMLADLLVKFGKWPVKCPVEKGFEFQVLDVVLDPGFLPKYVPEADVLAHVFLFDRNVKFWESEVIVKIVHKKNSKAG